MTRAAANEFTLFVDRLASTLVAHSPTFEAFVGSMPGVLPDEALAALHRMTGANAARLAADAVTDRAGVVIDQGACLPLPHPFDSEFRFDQTTARILAAELVSTTRDGDEILLIGVPSVAAELAAMGVDRRVRFLGPDNCVTATVNLAFGDERLSLDQGPGGSAAAALLDPPWYAQPMTELIRVCAAGCRRGALIKLVLPPIGTRPEIAADRSAFLDVAIAAGFSPTGIEGPVCYRTPLFELAAMERQGIARLPSWRRGEAQEFAATGAIREQRWVRPRPTEFSIDGIRLRLVRGTADGGVSLAPIGDHEIFPSVSARAVGRDAATLWTTTNRAFIVDYDRAHAALTALARGGARDDMLHLGFSSRQNELSANARVAADDRLIHQLVELLGRELHDARRLVGDGAWKKTAMEWRF